MPKINKHILDYHPLELEQELLSLGQKKFRMKQITQWIFQKRVFSFEEMSSLSKELRESLTELFSFKIPQIVRKQQSVDGTTKYLLQLEDNNKIEMVLIPSDKKNTLCVSSQVGCARKCQFCATATLGLSRNLTVAEILSQILIAVKELEDKRLTNIVFMGMGEPLDNYDNLVKALSILQHENGLKFSPRRITVSTCGVVPAIQKLSDSGIKTKLAVSLNSAIDDNRNILMPINQIYKLDELKKSLQDFRRKTNFRITFEYIMISNFNMSKADVKAIRKFVGDMSCKINLIPWNTVEGLPYRTPTETEIDKFRKELEKLSVAITTRKSRGQDIDAACGQLAAKDLEEK